MPTKNKMYAWKEKFLLPIKIIPYHRCKLVHADFNQFNTLWHEGHVWVIDVSQSVEPVHPMGLEFLLRDCTNIYKVVFGYKLVEIEWKLLNKGSSDQS